MKASVLALAAMYLVISSASAQTTSIARRHDSERKTTTPVRGVMAGKAGADPRRLILHKGHPALEKAGLTAVKVIPPRTFKVHDLITVIVREQRKFESDGELETKKKFDIKSQFGAMFNLIDGGIGAATFSRGAPNVDLKVDSKIKNEADKEREDRFITRITGEIIDVKPNGNLVVQAKAKLSFDNEITVITLTGVARSVDVTPDNSILSTQLSDKVIDVQNSGAVRDGSRRGWIPRLLDAVRPF